MAYNADDPEQVKKAKKRAEQEEALKNDVIKNIMSTPAGRAWVYELLNRCHIYHTPFVQGHPDVTAFNCGEQNFGNQLLADVQIAASGDYLTMIKEAKASK